MSEIQTRIDAAEEAVLEAKKRLADLRREAEPEAFEDFYFRDRDGGTVRLSELFGDAPDLILVHNMGTSCPYCTMWADGLNGLRGHLENRAAFAVVSPDTFEKQRAFADGRGWNFRMFSAAECDFTKAAGFEADDGSPMPGVSTFRKKDDGRIERVGRAWFGPGDDFCATWHLFDLLADGTAGWQPKFSY